MHLFKLNEEDNTWPETPNRVYGDSYSLAVFGKQSNICFYGCLTSQYVVDIDQKKQLLEMREAQVNDAVFTHNDTRLIITNDSSELKLYHLKPDSANDNQGTVL